MSTWIQHINPIGTAWLEALWRASWQGGIALLLVWVVCSAFKRLPARARSWLWRLAYLKLLVTFFCTTPIDLPLLPAKARPADMKAANPVSAPPVASPQPPMPQREVTTTPNALPAFTATTTTSQTQTVPAARAQTQLAPAAWLLTLWLGGVLCFGICLWRKLHQVRRVQGTCLPVTDSALLQSLSELARRFRLHSAPTLLISDTVSSPLLMRALHPVIVLPSTLTSVSSPQDLRLMLAHEMAHVKRFDLWWAWLAVAGESLFFFHPLLWLARRQWGLAREMACDELAVRVTSAPVSAYGDMLVGAAALNLARRHDPLLATIGLTETQQMLVKRINAMKLLHLNPTKSTVLATTAVLAAGLLNLLPLRLVAQPSSEAPPAGEMSPGGRVGGRSMGGFSRGMSSSGLPSLTPPTNVAPARFEATVYEVMVPEERIAELDAAKMESEATTHAKLAAFLGTFGTVRTLYKIDQLVNLYGENITMGTQEPMVTSVVSDSRGMPRNSIMYQNVGLLTRISATPPENSKTKVPEVQLNFQLSTITSGGVEISEGVPASRMRNIALSQSGTPKFGKPTVLVTASAAGATQKTPPVAYVIRYLLTQTKP
jgi:beta-lactamase regulating signal transducer with metallopeptidase domain